MMHQNITIPITSQNQSEERLNPLYSMRGYFMFSGLRTTLHLLGDRGNMLASDEALRLTNETELRALIHPPGDR